MIFPVKGGRFNAVNKKLRKHEETPTPSSERIFIRPCRTADGKSTFTTTPKPAQIVYSVNGHTIICFGLRPPLAEDTWNYLSFSSWI